MSDRLDLKKNCPHLGLRLDQETWHGFPSDENLCYKSKPARLAAKTYQSSTCLTSNYINCPIFQHQGSWKQTLPKQIRLESSDKDSVRKWDSQWILQVTKKISPDKDTPKPSSLNAPVQPEDIAKLSMKGRQSSPPLEDALPPLSRESAYPEFGKEEDDLAVIEEMLPEAEDKSILIETTIEDDIPSVIDTKLAPFDEPNTEPVKVADDPLSEVEDRTSNLGISAEATEKEDNAPSSGENFDNIAKETERADEELVNDDRLFIEEADEKEVHVLNAEETFGSAADGESDISDGGRSEEPDIFAEEPIVSSNQPRQGKKPVILLFLSIVFIGLTLIIGAGVFIFGGTLFSVKTTPAPTATQLVIVVPTLFPSSTPSLIPTTIPQSTEVTEQPTEEPTLQPVSLQESVAEGILLFDSNLRTGPGTNYDIIELLLEGTQLSITGRDQSAVWFRVRTQIGTEGWIAVTQIYILRDIDITSIPVVSAP